MFLESFTKHPSRSTADHMFKSVLCGRCGTVNYYPLLNPPACRRVWLEGVVLVSVLGLYLFLCALAARFCFV